MSADTQAEALVTQCRVACICSHIRRETATEILIQRSNGIKENFKTPDMCSHTREMSGADTEEDFA